MIHVLQVIFLTNLDSGPFFRISFCSFYQPANAHLTSVPLHFLKDFKPLGEKF